MKPQIPYRDITSGKELEQRISDGVEAVYQVAKAAFGPKAGNVLLENNYHLRDPVLSRDGVTNVQKVFLKDHVSNMAARIVVQASKKSNQTVGDGTTGAVLLTSYFYEEGRKLLAAKYNRMQVSRMIEESANDAIEYVESVSREVKDKELRHVAKVACGDEAIGNLITDTVEEVGSESGVIVEEHGGSGIYSEIIDGFYLRKGFADVRLISDFNSLVSDFKDVPILLLGKTITESKEMRSIIERITSKGFDRLVILGDVIQDALDVLVRKRIDAANNVQGGIIATLVNIPSTAGMKSIALEDFAVLTGGVVYQDGQRASGFDISYLGAAKRVVVEEHSTTIVSPAGDTKAIEERLNDLEKQLQESTSEITTNALKDRVARLRGKIGLIKVGAPTEVDREELRLRIDDAVCALQAARKGGVVAGGGSTLARVMGTHFDSVFKRLFLDLMDNAGENGDWKLGKLLEQKEGYGYDLRNLTDKPIDLYKSGVVDPTLVVTEVVRNAASVASKLITVTCAITFTDEETTK